MATQEAPKPVQPPQDQILWLLEYAAARRLVKVIAALKVETIQWTSDPVHQRVLARLQLCSLADCVSHDEEDDKKLLIDTLFDTIASFEIFRKSAGAERYFEILQILKEQVVLSYLRKPKLALATFQQHTARAFPESGPTPAASEGRDENAKLEKEDVEAEKRYVAHHGKMRAAFLQLFADLKGKKADRASILVSFLEHHKTFADVVPKILQFTKDMEASLGKTFLEQVYDDITAGVLRGEIADVSSGLTLQTLKSAIPSDVNSITEQSDPHVVRFLASVATARPPRVSQPTAAKPTVIEDVVSKSPKRKESEPTANGHSSTRTTTAAPSSNIIAAAQAKQKKTKQAEKEKEEEEEEMSSEEIEDSAEEEKGAKPTLSRTALALVSPPPLQKKIIARLPVSGKQRERKRWSQEEVEALEKGIKLYGVGQWSQIKGHWSTLFRDRTQMDLKDKWRNITKNL